MHPTRRTVLAGAAAVLARPAFAQGERATTLRYIPQADVTILDPLGTTSYPTRNHGYMCWDTLYGVDTGFRPQPQLAEGHSIEDDGKRWTFTLRPGLRFHDGAPIRASDAVASIKRWMPKDTLGQTLATRLDEIRALDDRRFEFRLRRPFGLLLDALAKPSSYPCFIYPERFAVIDPATPFTEIVGSGPYRFVASEHVFGALVVYRRFDGYIPTPVGTPEMTAGPKLAAFERVEWHVIPDPATSAAALQAGEMDWWEVVDPDLSPLLARAPNLVLDRIDSNGTYATLRMNQLYPPFDDPAVRRALLPIVSQADFMSAVAGDDGKRWRDQVGFFPVASSLANDSGMQALTSKRDPAAAKAALAAGGHAGAKIVALHATDVSNQKALMSVATDMLGQAGFSVDDATSDWGTVLQRRASMKPPAEGGWNVFTALFSGMELVTPAGHLLLRGNGKAAWFGWPTAPKLEALRDAWFDAPDLAAQQKIAREIQLQAFQDLPYIPIGQYFVDSAYQKGLTGIRRGIPLPLNVKRA